MTARYLPADSRTSGITTCTTQQCAYTKEWK